MCEAWAIVLWDRDGAVWRCAGQIAKKEAALLLGAARGFFPSRRENRENL
jgi:hypothetical protein